MKKSYYEKLKDPQWQKKRLEIMERAGFECENCGEKTKTLNVHHLVYCKNVEPWGYPDKFLKCFCEDCHERWHMDRELLLLDIAEMEAEDGGLDSLEWFVMWKRHQNRNAFYAVLKGLIHDKERDDEIAQAVRETRDVKV